MNSINNMSENKTAVTVGIMSAEEDGSTKIVVFPTPKSPPLLGPKAVRVHLSQIANLLQHAPHSPSPTGELRQERTR